MYNVLNWAGRIDPGPPKAGKVSRHRFFKDFSLGILSVFCDEAGTLGAVMPHDPYYILTLVFHEQSKPIAEQVKHLEHSLGETKHVQGKAIHTGPIIRQNESYANQSIDERRHQFFRLMAFIRSCDLSYKSFMFKKTEYDSVNLVGRISRELSLFIRDNLPYFTSFDRVILYYDSGQPQVAKVLSSVFNTLLFDVEIRRVRPADYYLFQTADLICTLELLAAKRDNSRLTKSDKAFFYKSGEMLRQIKAIRKKRFDQ